MNYRTHELAKLLGVDINTLFTWRKSGIGPEYIKSRKEILYPESSVIFWLESVSTDKIAHLDSGYIRSNDAAKILGVADQTLRKWRHQNRGPHYAKFAGYTYYARSSIEDFQSLSSERL